MAKHHKHHKHVAADLPLDELERKAHEALAAERWRQARDFFKLLCKQDHAKYLPGLIQANRGLAEALMQKGQVSEAEQVLAHLRTIAPKEEFGVVELKGSLRTEGWSAAAQTALQLWTAGGDALSEKDREAVADALVLAFPNVEEGGEAADWPDPVRSELTAVLSALRAVSEERYEAAQDFLRPLPRASIFASWKTLIKGWIAFYTGAREKARSLLAMLPPDGVPARAAESVRVLTEPKSLAGPRTAERDNAAASVCRFLGAPEIGNVLVQADELWKAGKVVDSLQLMRRAREFPSTQSTLAGALSEFYFRAAFTLRDPAQEKYFDAFGRLHAAGNLKNAEEKFLVDRMFANDALLDPYGELEDEWRDFLKHFKSDPRRAKLTSLALVMVADRLTQREPEMGIFGFGPARDGSGLSVATRLLKESIRENPENLAAYLKLLEIYKRDKGSSERNRLLDEMTQRFPDEKAVLMQAGIGCIERKTYVKGLGYLERARQLDPLDPQVADWIVVAQIRLARQQYEKKQTEKARATFRSIASRPSSGKLDFNSEEPFLHARQGILELLHGDKTTGEQLLAQARQEARSLSCMLMFMHGSYRSYAKEPGRGKQSPFWEELSKTQPHGARERMELLEALTFVLRLGEDLKWQKEIDLVMGHLAPAAKEEFTMEEAAELSLLLWSKNDARKLVKRLVKEGLRRDPENPRFRVLDVLLEPEPPYHRVTELEDAVADARNAGDLEVVKAAEGPLETLLEVAGPSIFDEWDDEGDEEGEEPVFGGLPPMPGGFPIEEIAEMKRAAEKMSDKEFAAFRKESSKYVPLPVFDILMGTRSKDKSAPKRRGDDQAELF